MNISGVSYNGNVENTEQKFIRPLQNEGSKGELTGMKLSEGKRLDSWEITHVQSENSVSLANTYQPGGSIKVVHTEDRHYLRNTEQYFGVFEQYAKGQISEDEFTAYSAAFGSKIRTTLHTDRSTVGGLNALVNEMKENISKGIANTPDNLKTKLFAGGIEVTWKELMNMQKTGEYIDSFLAAGGSGTYMTYANIGIARAYVHKSGLGLTEEQVKAETSRCLGCGASVVDPNKCIGCGICTTKCVFDAISLHRELPGCSTMVKSEDKLKYVLPNMIKQSMND